MSATELSAHRGRWTPLELPAAGQRFVHACGTPFETTDPATGEVVAYVGTSQPSDVDAAVTYAQAAVRDPAWRDDGARRGKILWRFAEALRANEDRLAELLTREQGKKLFEARSEINGAADMVEFYAGRARGLYGRSIALKPGVHGVVLREPVGVVAIITPWNWPLTLLARALAPALAAGNAVVVKPASLTPAITVETLALLAGDEHLPEGALTCLLGSGAVVGEALVRHPGIDMIAFTGESSTGIDVMKHAADGLKKVSLELGGKSPNVVFADANFDKALAGAENAGFSSSGQICTAGSRLVVERAIADEFISRLAERVEAMRVGDGLEPSTDIAPVVSRGQQRAIVEYVELGRREGTIAAGGHPLHDGSYEAGAFVAPTIITDLAADARVVQEEIFGPVLAVQIFEDEDEAIEMANGTPYGLASGLWTNDLNRAWRVGRAIEAGTVWINTYHHFYPETEVGGFGASGIGRQQGLVGLEEFTETKHLNFDSNPTLW